MLRFLWLALFTALLPGLARAADVNFNGGNVPKCSLKANVYSCNSNFLGANDTAAIASGYTVIVNGNVQLAYAQGLKMTGSARFETSGGNIDLSASAFLNVASGTIKADGDFMIGASAQTISANVLANNITTAGAGVTINGNVTVTGTANLGSNTRISGSVDAGSVTTGSSTQIGSGLTARTSIYLGSASTITGATTAATISTDSGVKFNGNVTATSSFVLGSGSTMNGNIDAPTTTLNSQGSVITGNVKATTALDMGSSSNIIGTVTAGTLTLRAQGAVINGNATIQGDVTMESGTTINGDLDARNVYTKSGNAIINGNAAVNYIYIDWNNAVNKVITCKAGNTVGCGCVEKPQYYNYSPTCGSPASAPHHFQITHGGYGLTCQPQTVTVTACANAACTAPHYNGSIKTTLQPGGSEVTVTGGVNTAATVSRSTAGTATLSASGTGTTTCVNTGANNSASCEMVFSDNGLSLSVADHVSMTEGAVTVQALKKSADGKSCIPLVKGTTTINFNCQTIDPANGRSTPLWLRDQDAGSYTSLSCGSNTGVTLKFNDEGLAQARMQYAEAGKIGLSASYTSGNLGASTPGATAFTVAPARIRLRAVRKNTSPKLADQVFARAGEEFTLTAEAVNALADDPGNWGANVTTNFGKEKSPQNFKIDKKVSTPENSFGEISGDLGAIKDGVASGTWSFSDVGAITFTAVLASSSKNYMDVSATGFATTGVLVLGNFIPDHFDVSLPTRAAANTAPAPGQVASGQVNGMTMACKQGNMQLLTPCDSNFVYAGQPFYVVVTAYNGAGAVTRNYAGALARTIALSAWAQRGGATAVDANAVGTLDWSAGNSATRFGFVTGVGALGTNLSQFTFKQAPSASNASDPVQFYLRAIDTDGVSSQRGPGNVVSTTADKSVEQALTAVSGRLLVGNSFGSAATTMPITLQAQFYADKRWQLNPAYAQTGLDLSNSLRYSACQRALLDAAAPTTCSQAARLALASNSAIAFTSGQSVFRVQPPAPRLSAPGSVGLSVKQSCAGGFCTATTPEWIPYLPSTTGRATFGIYGNGPVIYTREVY